MESSCGASIGKRCCIRYEFHFCFRCKPAEWRDIPEEFKSSSTDEWEYQWNWKPRIFNLKVLHSLFKTLRVFGRGKRRRDTFQKALEDYRKSGKVFASCSKILRAPEKFYDLWKILKVFDTFWNVFDVLYKFKENSKSFWKILRVSENFWKLLRGFWKSPKTFRILQKSLEDSENLRKRLKVSEDFPRPSTNSENFTKELETFLRISKSAGKLWQSKNCKIYSKSPLSTQ